MSDEAGAATDPSICLAPCVEVMETELGSELCLLQTRTDEVLVLNTTAADLWRLLDGRTPVDRAVELLALNYGLPAAEVVAAVGPLVEDLRRRGFLDVATHPS